MSNSLPAWIVVSIVGVASGLWILRVIVRARIARRERWREQVLSACRDIEALRTALSRLLHHVPERTHWNDDGWDDGERKAEELCSSIEELGLKVPRRDRDSVWNLIASLRALVISIGIDPRARARPARAAVIRLRLQDLGPMVSSLEGGLGRSRWHRSRRASFYPSYLNPTLWGFKLPRRSR
jgi:hypothetical protein